MTTGAFEADLEQDLKAAIRDVPDFPKPGILFKDITPLLADSRRFALATEAMSAPFRDAGITKVVAIESRGFLLGGPVAQRLKAGLVPVRKTGKLPHRVRLEEYALEYGTDRLEIHCDGVCADDRVLVVDDVLATGGTASAAGRLVTGLEGELVGFTFLMRLSFLDGVGALQGRRVHSVLTY